MTQKNKLPAFCKHKHLLYCHKCHIEDLEAENQRLTECEEANSRINADLRAENQRLREAAQKVVADWENTPEGVDVTTEFMLELAYLLEQDG